MLRLRDIMTKQVLTVSPELPLRDVIDVLTRHKVTGLPVVAGRKVVGVITTGDLIAFLGSAPSDEEGEMEDEGDDESAPRDEDSDEAARYFVDLWPEDESDLTERFERQGSWHRDLLGDHVVSEAMSTTRCVLGPDAPVTAAARMMRRYGEHRVLVVKNGGLLGIVSASDIVRAVAVGGVRDDRRRVKAR
ncbi:MAG TPA: CBS domain-containing protein [Gemmatimonadaceae bacterium]|nr:CBS domain-containing protein [Gemmatimonadaceae bacterium]